MAEDRDWRILQSCRLTPRLALGPDEDEGRATGDADLGGLVCLALARRLGVRVLPTDRAWQRIAAAQVEIQIIR